MFGETIPQKSTMPISNGLRDRLITDDIIQLAKNKPLPTDSILGWHVLMGSVWGFCLMRNISLLEVVPVSVLGKREDLDLEVLPLSLDQVEITITGMSNLQK